MSPDGVLFFSTSAKSFLLTPASTIWMQCLSDDTVTIKLFFNNTTKEMTNEHRMMVKILSKIPTYSWTDNMNTLLRATGIKQRTVLK
jgi:hypothetical protein